MDKLVNWNQIIDTNNIAVDSNAHLDILRAWLIIAAPLIILIAVSVGLFFGGASLQWHVAFLGALLCAGVGGMIALYVSLQSLDLAQDVLIRRCEQWQRDKQALRDFQQLQLDREPTQTVNVKGTANIADTMNQVNVGEMSDVKALTMALAHQREFRERVAKLHEQYPDDTGVELKYWLQNYNAFADYQFGDGKRITQREHKLLAESLKPLGEYPDGRRQGSSGRAVKVIE